MAESRELQEESSETPAPEPARRRRKTTKVAKKPWEKVLDDAAADEIADILHLLPKGAQAKLYYVKAGKKKYLGSVSTAEVDAAGGFEEFIQTSYGGGSFFVQLCITAKRITRSFALEIAGQPTEALVSLLAQPSISPFTKSDSLAQATTQPGSAQPNTEIEALKAKLEAMERKAEQNEIIGAFQAENDEIKKQILALSQIIEKAQTKPDSGWKELIPVAAAGVGGLVSMMKDIITDRPSSVDMLKSSGAMIKGISDFMSNLKDLNPTPPPPPTSDQTGSGLDAILKAAAPQLVEVLSSRAAAPGAKIPESASGTASPLPSQNGNFPKTQEKLDELSGLIVQRINADVVADALVDSYKTAIEENALAMLPELANLQADPQSALNNFLARFGLESVEGNAYKQKIVEALFAKLSGQPQPVTEEMPPVEV